MKTDDHSWRSGQSVDALNQDCPHDKLVDVPAISFGLSANHEDRG